MPNSVQQCCCALRFALAFIEGCEALAAMAQEITQAWMDL